MNGILIAQIIISVGQGSPLRRYHLGNAKPNQATADYLGSIIKTVCNYNNFQVKASIMSRSFGNSLVGIAEIWTRHKHQR